MYGLLFLAVARFRLVSQVGYYEKGRKPVTAARMTLLTALFLAVFIFPSTASAAIDAETVVTGKCTACHMADRIRTASKTEEEWTVLVDKEMNRGAQLSESERDAIIPWLALKYGKTNVAAAPADSQVAQTEQTAQTPVNQTDASQTLPFDQQAQTGVELWQFLLGGGALAGGGALMRRRKN